MPLALHCRLMRLPFMQLFFVKAFCLLRRKCQKRKIEHLRLLKREASCWGQGVKEPFSLEHTIDIAQPCKKLVLELSATTYALMARLVASSTRLLQKVVGDPWPLKSSHARVVAWWKFPSEVQYSVGSHCLQNG